MPKRKAWNLWAVGPEDSEPALYFSDKGMALHWAAGVPGWIMYRVLVRSVGKKGKVRK